MSRCSCRWNLWWEPKEVTQNEEKGNFDRAAGAGVDTGCRLHVYRGRGRVCLHGTVSKIIDTTSEAGLHFKLPFVDSVKYFTDATQLYDIPPSEVLTSDKQNMTVDCYILWKISDPKLFYQTLGSTAKAEERLDAITYSALKPTWARWRRRTSST